MNREQLAKAIDFVQKNIELPNYVNEILQTAKEKTFYTKTINEIYSRYNINGSMAKIDFLNVTLEYIKIILETNAVNEQTMDNVRLFKLLFHIDAGEFYFHKKSEIEQVIKYQLAKFYDDNKVSADEAFLKTEIQEFFDLSFDQMNEYAKKEALDLLRCGISPLDLDVFLTHNEYSSLEHQ